MLSSSPASGTVSSTVTGTDLGMAGPTIETEALTKSLSESVISFRPIKIARVSVRGRCRPSGGPGRLRPSRRDGCHLENYQAPGVRIDDQMSLTMGPYFGGRKPRDSPRSRRRATFRIETLEPRLLMAGVVPSPAPLQLPLPPAQVADSEPFAPVTLRLLEVDSTLPSVAVSPEGQERIGDLSPGGGTELYRVSIGPETGDLWLDVRFETLPKSDSGDLFVLGNGADLLIHGALEAASQSNNLALSGRDSTPHELLYAGMLFREQASASSSSGTITHRLQITLETLPAAYEIGTPGIANGMGVRGPWGTGAQNGAQYGVSVQGQSPSWITSTGAVAVTATTFGGSEAQSSRMAQSPSAHCPRAITSRPGAFSPTAA